LSAALGTRRPVLALRKARVMARPLTYDEMLEEERHYDRDVLGILEPNGVIPEPGLLGGLRTGSWLDAQTFPPLAYAIPELVAEGLTFNAGPPKIGKSWELLDFAL